MNPESHFIGIDFGTTNSCMAWLDPQTNRPEVLLNAEGESKTPSVVYYGPQEVLVGKIVENYLEDIKADHDLRIEEEKRIIRSVKRKLTQSPVISLPDNKVIKPVQVVADILKKLKNDIEKGYLHGPVNRAVLTYPVTFDALQRKTLEEASRLAGFHQVEMVEESVAAAMAFAGANPDLGRGLVVYDLGGGTFDLACLAQDPQGNYRVALEPDGESRCGGDDFDQLLYLNFQAQIARKLGRPHPTSPEVDVFLLRECRRRKEDLSHREAVTYSYFTQGQAVKLEASRTEFEQSAHNLIAQTVRKTLRMCQQAAQLGHSIDTIALIGGSSRIPYVKRLLEETLRFPVVSWGQTDVAVALGAAMYAGQAFGLPKPQPFPKPIGCAKSNGFQNSFAGLPNKGQSTRQGQPPKVGAGGVSKPPESPRRQPNPTPGAGISSPPLLSPQQIANKAETPVSIMLSYPGRFFLVDMKMEVYLDYQLVGPLFLKKPFVYRADLSAAKHVLEIRYPRFNSNQHFKQILELQPGAYSIELQWNRLLARFTDAIITKREVRP